MSKTMMLLAAAALALFGCASPAPLDPTFTVVLDPTLEPAKAQAAIGALEEWRAKAPCEFTFHYVVGPTGAYGSPLPARGILEVREDDIDPAFAGFGKYDAEGGSRLTIRRDYEGDEHFAFVLRHEAGHALHLDHDDSVTSLMNADPPVDEDITAHDVARLGGIWCSR